MCLGCLLLRIQGSRLRDHHKVRVLLTLLDGKPVYCDPKFKLP